MELAGFIRSSTILQIDIIFSDVHVRHETDRLFGVLATLTYFASVTKGEVLTCHPLASPTTKLAPPMVP